MNRLFAKIFRGFSTSALWSLLIAVAAVIGTPAVAGTIYDKQLSASKRQYFLNGPNQAGAQEFVATQTDLVRLSAFIVNLSTTGVLTAQVRSKLSDAGSVVASGRFDLSGTGSSAGWIDFPVHAHLDPGRTYYLVLQSSGTDDSVLWFGTHAAVAGSLPSWRYDKSLSADWHPEESSHPAFGINLTGTGGCAASSICYRAVADFGEATAGLMSNGQTTAVLTPLQLIGASFVPGSDVLQLADGRWMYLPAGAAEPVSVPANDAPALAQIAESREWLAAGTIPGTTSVHRAVAERALLSMRALLQPNGSFAAAWVPFWEFSWPRDSSFAAAAFAATGHSTEAYRILTYTARTQRSDGTWEARTKLDGSGPPDDRAAQLDGNGWVPWAVWQWYQAAPKSSRLQMLRSLYATVQKSANYAAASLDPSGLPPPSPDYWELGTSTPNIGTAAPLLAGFHAAASLAHELGQKDDAQRWSSAAIKLSTAISVHFAPRGYPRTADGLHGRDSAIAFMAPPFNEAPSDLAPALESTYRALKRGTAGLVIPGDDPGQPWDNTWTPSTSFFALAWAGLDRSKAHNILDIVLKTRSTLDELPEQAAISSGRGRSVTPLGWTDALVLMTLTQLGPHPMPTPSPMAK